MLVFLRNIGDSNSAHINLFYYFTFAIHSSEKQWKIPNDLYSVFEFSLVVTLDLMPQMLHSLVYYLTNICVLENNI